MKIKNLFKSHISGDALVSVSLFLFVLLYHLPVTILIPEIIRKPLLIAGLLLFLFGVAIKNLRYAFIFISVVIVEMVFYLLSWRVKLSFASYLFPAFISAEFLTCAVMLLDHKITIVKSFLAFFMIVTFITSVTTIIGLLKYPTAVRTLGQIADEYNSYWQRIYRTMNIAGWGLLFGMSFATGTFLYLFKKKQKRLLMLVAIIADFICIVLSQLMFAILLTGLLLIIGIIINDKKGIMIRIIPIIVLILILWLVREQILTWMYTLLSGSKFRMLSLRIKNLNDLLVNKDTSGDAGARFELYSMSLTSFLHHPLGRFFCGTEGVMKEIGFHSEFCDLIGTLGIFGVLLIIFLVILFWRRLRIISYTYDKRYYISMVGVFAIMFFINPIIPYPHIWLSALVVPLVAMNQINGLDKVINGKTLSN